MCRNRLRFIKYWSPDPLLRHVPELSFSLTRPQRRLKILTFITWGVFPLLEPSPHLTSHVPPMRTHLCSPSRHWIWKSGLIINKNPSHSVSNPVSAAFQSSGDSFYLINNGLSKLEETVFMVYFHSTRFLSDKIIQKYLKLPLLNYAVFVYRNWKRSKWHFFPMYLTSNFPTNSCCRFNNLVHLKWCK